MPYEAVHDPEKCCQCGMCSKIVACPGAKEEICIGCGACVLACPNQALILVEVKRGNDIPVDVDGKLWKVPERISVKEALQEIGYRINTCLPAEGALYAPCQVGACWNCAVQIDGKIRQACVTEVKKGMKIRTALPDDSVPLRIIGQIIPHPSAGVGTPWEVRARAKGTYLELACLVAGCNFRCPQCQNWMITYMGNARAFTPTEAATMSTKLKRKSKLNRFCISGGECTLNKTWLVQFLKKLKEINPEPETHFHISTNGSLLTEDYIDELVDAGLTDIGIDLKGLQIDTFMRISGLLDREVAGGCKENAWKAVGYISRYYREKLFLGIGIPYNRELISLDEVHDIAREIYNIDPRIQTTALTYTAQYRSRIPMPSLEEMKTVHHILKEAGLTVALRQTSAGTFGPSEL